MLWRAKGVGRKISSGQLKKDRKIAKKTRKIALFIMYENTKIQEERGAIESGHQKKKFFPLYIL